MFNLRKKFENVVTYTTMVHCKQMFQEMCRNTTNVYVMAQEKAARQAFQYIETNMPLAHICLSPEDILHYAIDKVEIPGLFLEFGVATGQSIGWISKDVRQEVHGFDSFEGLPEDMVGFYAQKGTHNLNGVLPAVPPNVILHKGWFDKVLPKFLDENPGNVAFLHLDANLYSSTKTVINLLRPRIIKGTIIVFDDYFDYPSWQMHEFKVFAEFVEEHNVKYEYLAWRPGRMKGTENGGACVKILAIS